MIFTAFLLAEIFTVAAKIKVSAHTLSAVDARARPHVEDVNNVRSNVETWITPDELCGAFFLDVSLVVNYIRKSFRNVLWTTSPGFPSSCGDGIMNNFSVLGETVLYRTSTDV